MNESISLNLGPTYSRAKVNHNANTALQKKYNAFYEHRPGTVPKNIKPSPVKQLSRNPVTQ